MLGLLTHLLMCCWMLHLLSHLLSASLNQKETTVLQLQDIEVWKKSLITLNGLIFVRIVEWSKRYDFSAIDGSFVLSDLTYKLDPHSHSIEYTIPDLETVSHFLVGLSYHSLFLQGEKYFVRVSASNIKRYGPAAYSVPTGAIPCSKCMVFCVNSCVTSSGISLLAGWHDVEGTEPRYAGSTGTIQTIAMQLKQVINESSSEFLCPVFT